MENTKHEYALKAGLFDGSRKLIITPDYIEFENNTRPSSSIRIDKASFVDVKYQADWIVWYRFNVGHRYKIDIKYNHDQVLSISFVTHFYNNDTGETYTDISKWIGSYFLSHIINNKLEELQANKVFKYNELVINQNTICFGVGEPTLQWAEVGLKEYHKYFVVFKKDEPKIHKRISFEDWNSEVLFNVLKTFIAEEKTD